jgi:hypothetical protein
MSIAVIQQGDHTPCHTRTSAIDSWIDSILEFDEAGAKVATCLQQWRNGAAPTHDKQPQWRALEEASERTRLADADQHANAAHQRSPHFDRGPEDHGVPPSPKRTS